MLFFWFSAPPGKNNLPHPSLPFMWKILKIAYAKSILENMVHSSWVFCKNFCSAIRHAWAYFSQLWVVQSGLKRTTVISRCMGNYVLVLIAGHKNVVYGEGCSPWYSRNVITLKTWYFRQTNVTLKAFQVCTKIRYQKCWSASCI